ncbi:MAG: hypothetical protein ACRD2G_16920 [Terriglobia bacterium]
MRNVFYGALCGAFVFAMLSWVTTKKAVHAEVLTAPPAGRFQLVQLHPSQGSTWSAILDTETGCTWVYTTNNVDDPKITFKPYKFYLQVLGQNFWGAVNYDPTEYMFLKTNSDGTVDYTPQFREITRVQAACSRARLQALSAAGGH